MSLKNSCFSAPKPLPGHKRSFPDVNGRVVPSCVRKSFRIPEEDYSLNLSSSILQTLNAKKQSSSIPCSQLQQPVQLTTQGFPFVSKIPVRIKNFSDKTQTPHKDLAQTLPRSENKTSKISVWVRLDCTAPRLLEIQGFQVSSKISSGCTADASVKLQLAALKNEPNKLLDVKENENHVSGNDLPSREKDGAKLIVFRKKWFLEPPTTTHNLVDLPKWATQKRGTKFVNEIPILSELPNARSTSTSEIIQSSPRSSRKKWFLGAPVVKYLVDMPNWAKDKIHFR
jgi:hypothetical protein